jgi:flavin-dependent dehydrogenase
LQGSGLDVLVLDKQVFPRDKVCGGWITPQVLRALDIDASEYGRGRILQPITRFRVGTIGAAPIESNYGAPVSYGIRRCEFDDYLLRRSGARLRLGVTLNSLKQASGEWIANDEIAARVVVGAGGHFCPVARLTTAKSAGESAIVAQECEFEMNAAQLHGCQIQGERPELYFCSDMRGYGWCFRKGDFLNIGLGRADQHQLSAQVGAFVDFLKAAGRISFDIPHARGHAYLLHGFSQRRVIDDGMLLIGDAAGLAYAQSGEGILPAVESGLAAARTISAANGEYECARLAPYRQQIAAPRPTALMRLGRSLPSQIISVLARGLFRTRWFVRNVVLDDWFLHA